MKTFNVNIDRGVDRIQMVFLNTELNFRFHKIRKLLNQIDSRLIIFERNLLCDMRCIIRLHVISRLDEIQIRALDDFFFNLLHLMFV
jgi:hypothetical protein